MTCELISVGTEILLGDILNTNARYLSVALAQCGIDVLYQHTVGDNAARLLGALDMALSRSDMVITTGGLGPTDDDLTKEVCAEYFGLPLEEDTESLNKIKAYYEERQIPMPQSNLKQAVMPVGSIILQNSNGTAPGCIMEKDGKVIVVLPGPPREMKPMFEQVRKDYLSKFTHGVILSHSVRTFGIGESTLAEKVKDLFDSPNPTVAPYAKSGEALLRVTAKADSEQQAQALISPMIDEIKRRVGKYIYAIDADSVEEATVALLKEKGLTAATAESCTGGLISKRITDISGSSEVFGCTVVSYSNEVKNKVLGVKKEHLDKYGAVSEVVCAEMAKGVHSLSGADIAVSVTGVAGPSPDEGKPVGLMYIGVTDGKLFSIKKLVTGQHGSDCRDYNRTVCASNAINMIRLYALGEKDGSCDIDEFINSF